MIFTETEVSGVFIIDMVKHNDSRGFFARSWCRREFADRGLNTNLVQMNVSYNIEAGTLRGMHYQVEPYAEAKLVRATSGKIWDVALDLRPDSPTYRRWFGVELSAANHRMLYIPEGCAHGYQTLVEHTEVGYAVSNSYEPAAGRGVRYDDPTFGIRWPSSPTVISERDLEWALV